MRYLFQFLVLIYFLNSVIELKAQFDVTDLSDLPDEDLTDNIYTPKTLRSAIQNANKIGGAAIIKVFPDKSTIRIASDLPVINVPVNFDGKGLILEPASGSIAKFGLWITSDNSIVRNVLIQNFSEIGLVWQGSDGLIEMIVSRNNGVNLNMNHAHRNKIGGALSGYYSNYFYGASGSSGQGIALVGTFADSVDGGNNDNIIQYCSIGTDEQGNAKPNRQGIYISMSKRNTIKNNKICGNEEEGIMIDGIKPGTDGNGNFAWLASFLDTQIENNSIGINNQGGVAIPNQTGIEIKSSMSDIILNNTISGNSGVGIFIADALCKFITIDSNRIGTDRFGTRAVGNGNGVRLNGSEHIFANNIISGNKYVGLSVSSPYSVIQSNIIGLDAVQTKAIPNGDDGILVWGSNIVIGDTSWFNANVVAGNDGDGISVVGANEKNIYLSYNFIGTNRDTTLSIPNKGNGIILTHSLSDVFIEDNIIASNEKNGIRVERNVVIFLDSTRPHLYQKPFNIDINNNKILGVIGGSGISIFNADSIYIYDNRIEETVENGISIENDSTRHIIIANNQIGPGFGAPEKKRIGGNGINIEDAKDVLIGGKLSGIDSNRIQNCNESGILTFYADSVIIDGNYIQGCNENGISVFGTSGTFTRITRNHIGPKNKDEEKLIRENGIYVKDAKDVLIGSQVNPSDSNDIRYCRKMGISVNGEAESVYSFGNSFFENQEGGIELDNLELYFAFGLNNDTLDADDGSNKLQNTTVMEISEVKDNEVKIKGKLRGYANTIYRIDAYLAKILEDSVKYKTQGTIYLDWFTVKTNEEGIAVIDTSWLNEKIAQYSTDYPFVTLTASGTDGTSCFSHISNPDLYVDIETIIDTSRTKVDENGNINLVASITNLGNDIVTTVSIRDTVSNFDLKNVSISKGTAFIVDSTFIATIPALAKGEKIEYNAYGKSKVTGIHRRRLVAYPSEADINPLNNADSISLKVDYVNTVQHEKSVAEKIKINLYENHRVEISNHGGGNISIRLFNLLGQLYNQLDYSASDGEVIEFDLKSNITLIEVIKDNKIILNKLLCSL